MKDNKLEIVADGGDRCGEGPIWDATRKRLLWTDIPSDVVYELARDSGEKRVVMRGTSVGGIALARDGGLMFGGGGGLWKFTEKSGCKLVAGDMQINDMIADPHGRIYAGTLYWGANGMEKHGNLYLIAADGKPRVVDDGVELANGLGFSVDTRTLYFADSAKRRIWAYDVKDSGELSGKRVLKQFSLDEGIPDGLTVDGEGFIWCAMWYGAKVVRLDSEGKLQRSFDVPAFQTSSVAFGGPEMDELYITTAGEAWPSPLAPASYKADAPQGGALYRARVGVRGKPEFIAAF